MPTARMTHVSFDLGTHEFRSLISQIEDTDEQPERYQVTLALDLDRLLQYAHANSDKGRGKRAWLGGAIQLKTYRVDTEQSGG